MDRSVVVLGGGAAGLMAAGRAAEAGARVILVEKGGTLGSKLLLSGKGRCNLTSAEEDMQTFLARYGPKGKFLYPAFTRFGPKETVRFFEDRGVQTAVERGKRVFPARGGATRVLNCLIGYLRQGNVTIYRNREALNLIIREGRAERFILRGLEAEGTTFIVATGGKSFPKTGSTGDGYRFAERAGHRVIPPEPALCPVRTREQWPLSAQGTTLRNVTLTLWEGGKKRTERFGEMLLTNFGISGSIAMDMSREIARTAEGGQALLTIDLKPALSHETLTARIGRDFMKHAAHPVGDGLKELLPMGLIPVVLERAAIPRERKVDTLGGDDIRRLVDAVKALSLTPDGLLGFRWAMVTAGGVDLREVDPRTMRSRFVENLYFAGEVLDLDGPTGGFNLQMCWSTGYLAGESAAKVALG